MNDCTVAKAPPLIRRVARSFWFTPLPATVAQALRAAGFEPVDTEGAHELARLIHNRSRVIVKRSGYILVFGSAALEMVERLTGRQG